MSFTSTSSAFIPPAGSVPRGDRGYTACTVAKAFAVIGGLAGTLVGPPALATSADPSKPTISADASAAIGEMGKTLLAPQFSFKLRQMLTHLVRRMSQPIENVSVRSSDGPLRLNEALRHGTHGGRERLNKRTDLVRDRIRQVIALISVQVQAFRQRAAGP